MQNTNQTLFTTDLSDKQKEEIQSILNVTKLGWQVRKENLISETGLETPSAGIFRNDNNSWLGTTSKKYTPYQNEELITTIHLAAEELGLKIESGGELKGGKKVFLQLELPTAYIGKSELKRYITAINSHNGLGAVGFGSTNDIINYSNQQLSNYKFFKISGNMDKFRHCSSTSQRVRVAVNQLFQTIKEDKQTMEMFELMSSTKINDALLNNIMQACYKVNVNNTLNDVTPRQLDKVKRISDVLTDEIEKEDGTIWGLFNGVLRYTKECAGNRKNENDYVMSGKGFKVNMAAYRTIIGYLQTNS